MSLMIYEKCWRGRTDCEALHCIDAIPEDVTEEQFMERTYVPHSFVCCGCIKPEDRTEPQDGFRLCFKNDVVDDMSDNDEQDLTHLMAVISHGLSILATRRCAQPEMDTLSPDGLHKVKPRQAI